MNTLHTKTPERTFKQSITEIQNEYNSNKPKSSSNGIDSVPH